MKHNLLLLVLFFFALGCRKYETQYSIICRFPPDYSTTRHLVVMNQEGRFIGRFNVRTGISSIEETLKTTDADAADHYDLHLIDSNAYFTTIFSHLNVPNGGPVFLNPEGAHQQSLNFVSVKITGIETFDSLYWTKTDPVTGYVYKAAEKRIYIDTYFESGQGRVFSLLANGETEVRHLYLSNATLSGNPVVEVSWEAFKPKSKTFAIDVPDTNPVLSWDVTAVSPDLKQFVVLHRSNLLPKKPQQGPLEFSHPDVLESHFAYAIKVVTASAHYEKTFQPGEPLRFEASDMIIRDASIEDKNIRIETEGDVDLLRLEFSNFRQISPARYYLTRWQISGTPAAFKNRELPNIDAWLPTELNKLVFYNNASVTAHQFGGHNYPQIREGFPWKSTEPFAVARSGYRAIRKDF